MSLDRIDSSLFKHVSLSEPSRAEPSSSWLVRIEIFFSALLKAEWRSFIILNSNQNTALINRNSFQSL